MHEQHADRSVRLFGIRDGGRWWGRVATTEEPPPEPAARRRRTLGVTLSPGRCDLGVHRSRVFGRHGEPRSPYDCLSASFGGFVWLTRGRTVLVQPGTRTFLSMFDCFIAGSSTPGVHDTSGDGPSVGQYAGTVGAPAPRCQRSFCAPYGTHAFTALLQASRISSFVGPPSRGKSRPRSRSQAS